jgi:Bacteriophage tail sheath protein
MAVATYKHGVTWRDVPTSIVAPITADSGIPVAVGVAPVYLANNPAPLNLPRIYYTFEEAVLEMGFSYSFHRYPLCEVMYDYFVLFNVGPIILSNVFDPDDPIYAGTPVVDSQQQFLTNSITLGPDIPENTVVVKDQAGLTTYVQGTDYILTNDTDANLVVTRLPGGSIAVNDQVKISYVPVDASKVTKTTIIGGVDPQTGKGTGLEVIDEVFPALGVVPGILLTPGWAQIPEVAAVLASKADNINGCFRCTAYVDIDSEVVVKANDVYAWKNTNNYVDHRLIACWPRVAIDDTDSWLSTEAAALTEWVDQSNDDVPVESPSNKNLKMNRTIAGQLHDPVDLFFGKSYADMLNGQGIVTAINWIGGWKLWGNNTSVYPSSSDPKDRWISVRRMTDWLGNTTVLTVYQFVDKPGNRRLIDAVIDSLNIWLNSLVSSGDSLGARVEFRQDENSDSDLISGHYKFHIYEAFPTPAEWIEFLLEFDISYLNNLFNSSNLQTPLTA